MSFEVLIFGMVYANLLLNYKEVMTMQSCVYMLASRRNGSLYVGVTNNLLRRVWEHRSELIDGFTKRYHIHVLVWFELQDTMEHAIRREKYLKHLPRKQKIGLIEAANPYWRDLYVDLV